jgi:hypothetical protein
MLTRFQAPYATVMVATYEPLILRWVSMWTIGTISTDLALRRPKGVQLEQKLPTAIAVGNVPRLPRPGLKLLRDVAAVPADPATPAPLDVTGQVRPAKTVGQPEIAGLQEPFVVGPEAFPRGVVRRLATTAGGVINLAAEGVAGRLPTFLRRVAQERATVDTADPNAFSALRTVPVAVNPAMGELPSDYDFVAARAEVMGKLTAAVDAALGGDTRQLQLDLSTALAGTSFTLVPVRVEEMLSPVGVAHFYRQLFFNNEEGVGPLEQAFTIAPLETLEVVYETVRRQIHEEQVEQGLETVSETASEEKNLDEVSDKVSSMIQRDSSAAMSVGASGGIGVWQASAEASASMATNSQRSREETSRRLKELTTRASERITKTFSLKTRDVQELTTTNLTRRVIRNDSADPVSYGLRRVLRRVDVKVQDLGPRLVWQVYVCEPGIGLARSKFVHFREPGAISLPDVPPGAPPRPTGGTDTGSTGSALGWDAKRRTAFVTVVVAAGADRIVDSVSIDSITDLEGGGKDDLAPSPRNAQQWDATTDPVTGTYTVKIGVLEGDAASVSLTYTYRWVPAEAVMAAWQAQVEALRKAATEATLQQQFDREKALITELRRIRQRPAADLRREERYEVMNRMVSLLFARGDDPSSPTPLEIEYFHRFFDVDAMFTYTHPSWWRPRWSAGAGGSSRPEYTITAESEPAPMGSSLGWAIQIDGDTRRNEFINSPWVRACLPIRRGREREALAWLARHVEGVRGYDPDAQPLKGVLDDILERRKREDDLGVDSPDYVTVGDGVTENPDPATPEGVYPIVHEFTVTVPTDGFVYERLHISGG